MRARFTAGLALAALVLTAAGATARVIEPRRATLAYAPSDLSFAVGAPSEEAVAWTGDMEAVYAFELKKGEKSVEVFVQDATEMPVGGVVAQWERTDGEEAGPASASFSTAVTWHRFCGRTTAPVPVKPKLDVRVTIYKGTCLDGTPSAPTTGEIVVDFHRR